MSLLLERLPSGFKIGLNDKTIVGDFCIFPLRLSEDNIITLHRSRRNAIYLTARRDA